MGHSVSWRGWTVCSCIVKIVEDVFEPRMRAERGWSSDRKLKIFQGCYNAGGVSASAGTHDAGGALDTEKLDDAGTKIARECGTTSWQRGSPEDSAFDDHNHWIWIGCPDLSSGAADQVYDYKNGRNGLADGGPDKSPDVPYITWQDAYENYDGSGVLGMTEINKPHVTKDQKITGDNEWHTLQTDDDGGLTLLTGPSDLYVATVHWVITGLPVGAVAQFRLCVQDDDTSSANKPTVTEYTYPITETIGTEGNTYGGLHWLNNLGGDVSKDVKRRLRLIVAPPVGVTITITDITSRIAY